MTRRRAGWSRDGLLLRGIRWRLGASLLTVLTATVAVATATLGPLYLHTAGDSVLRRTVAAAAVQNRGISLLPRTNQAPNAATMAGAARLLLNGPLRRRHEAVITTVDVAAVLRPAGAPPQGSGLLARTGICGHLRMARGRCDLGRDDVVVTAVVAGELKAAVGSRIGVGISGATAPLTLTVTGIAAPPDDAASYWWAAGGSYFPHEARDQAPSRRTDSLVVSPTTALSLPAGAGATVIEQIPVTPDAIDLADEQTVQASLRRTAGVLSGHGVDLVTPLPSLIAGADHQRHAMRTIVAIAAIQLVVLAVWVLSSLLVRSGDARRSEARVARLRGFPPLSMLWVSAAEPALLCVIGAALGVVVAWVVVGIARAQLFAQGSAIVFDGPTFAALGLTLLAIAGALGLGTVRLLRSADLAEGATRRDGAASRWGVVVDVVLVVLAVVALVALGTTGALEGHTDPVATAAPGLIALGTSVLAIQLILFTCRLGVSLSAGSGHIAAFLALRQTVRRPGVVRQARVLVIALCLACFATAAWSVARGNRATAARFAIGAPRVVSVDTTGAAALTRAVQTADPRGRWAMAAVALHTPSATLLAVQADRLPAVASWPRGISAAGIDRVSRVLAPAAAPVVDLADGPLRVSATATGATPRSLHDVDLDAWVFNVTGGTATVDLGRLRAGSAGYGANLSAVCPGGCRLTGLGLVPVTSARGPAPTSATLHVTAISTGSDRAGGGDLHPGEWRSTDPGVRVNADGLTFTAGGEAIAASGGASGPLSAPMIAVADRPLTIPAVVTSELARINSSATGPLLTEGLDAGTIGVDPVVRSSALPRVGADAAMVDLPLLAAAQTDPTSPDATDEVWLGAHAPADALAQLRSAGLRVRGVESSATGFTTLQHTGPGLADDFLLLSAFGALLVATASTLGALGATTRERATELSSLEIAGVARRSLVAALGLESLILLLTAVCGAGAGVLAAVLAVPSLPELVATTLAPIDHALPSLPIVVVCGAVLLAVALAAAAVATVLLSRMSPVLLRTGPDDVSG